MRKNILNINLSQLKKLEVQSLATSVIRIVEKHDPEILKIKEIFDLLDEQKSQIKLLKIGYGTHPITPKLNTLRKGRNAFCQGMMDQLKTIENGKMNGMEDALIIAKPIVLHYLQGLSKNSEKTIIQTLIQFFDTIAENTEFLMALTTLELMTYINNLKIVINEIEEQFNLRLEKVTARPKMNTHGIVTKLKSDIGDLFKQIEVAQIKNKELNYNILIDELNGVILIAKTECKTRASNNKKKAEGALNNDGIVVEGKSGESSQTSQTTTRMNPINVENQDGMKGGNSDKFDIEKTVAVPEKQTRLPIVSTEA